MAAGDALQDVITRTGFTINVKKTHFMYRTSRPAVTGLVVNRKINVRFEYRHNVRAMVNTLVTTGAFEIYGAGRRSARVPEQYWGYSLQAVRFLQLLMESSAGSSVSLEGRERTRYTRLAPQSSNSGSCDAANARTI